jgi:hypothetical protein
MNPCTQCHLSLVCLATPRQDLRRCPTFNILLPVPPIPPRKRVPTSCPVQPCSLSVDAGIRGVSHCTLPHPILTCSVCREAVSQELKETMKR